MLPRYEDASIVFGLLVRGDPKKAGRNGILSLWLRCQTRMDGLAMLFRSVRYKLELIDEPTYSRGSTDNVRSYGVEYDFADVEYRPASQHGLVLHADRAHRQSCILFAGGGASGVHEHSAVIVGDTCFVAVGDTISSLSLPSLDVLWHQQVDSATCFGVYFSPKYDCLISHGEIAIARISLAGEVTWSTAGADIFSEGFKLFPDYVQVVDFNKSVYCIDIATGKLPRQR
jgi:hypothetical protein